MFKLEVDKEIDLVFLQASLAPDLFKLIDNDREHLSQWMSWVSSTLSVADAESFIERTILAFSKEESMACAVEYQGKLAGIAGFGMISKSLKKVEIGYWIAAHLEGRGIIHRVCEKLIDYAFNGLQIEKVEIRVATENGRSR